MKEYIEEYFRVHASESTKPFDEIFEERFLERILIKTRLHAGDQNVGKVSKYMTPVEIGELYSSKELNILSSNKKTFRSDEAVSLDLQLKNIDKLTVKIFNFVPENYYLKNLAVFNNHVDLDGLTPNEELSFEYTDYHACTRFTKTFTFESIQKTQRGIFIIEFFSSGIASRAVVYKGTLSYFSRNTVAGQELVILDETGKIQKEGRVGVWLSKVFHVCDSEGRILIPYTKTSQSVILVLVS